MKHLIKKEFAKNKYIISLLIIIQIISMVFSLIFPYLNGSFVDLLVSKPTYSILIRFIMIIAFIGIISSVSNYIYKYLSIKVSNDMSFDLNLDILTHLQKIPIELYEKFNPTYLSQRIKGDADTIITFLLSNIVSFFLNGIIVFLLLILFYVVNINLFYISIIFLPIYCLSYIYLKKPLYRRKKISIEASNKYFDVYNSIFVRNREIKTSAYLEDERHYLKNEYNNYFEKIKKFSVLTFNFSAIDSIVSLLFQIAVLLIGGYMVFKGSMTIGEFTVMNTYFSMILEKIKYYFELGQSYQNYIVSRDRLDELARIEIESNGFRTIDSIDSIILHNVNYSFNKNLIYKEPINLCIKRSEIILLIGKNGSGKTTLMNILLGINSFGLHGDVYMNNIHINLINMYKLRKEKISIMTQNEKTSNITVADYFSKSHMNLKNPIKDAPIFKDIFISNEFNIIDLLDKKMSSLSSGERQLVLLYKTLLKKADLYILDEPTSNLHPLLRKKVWLLIEHIKKENKIVIIITHDNDMIENSHDISFKLD